MKILFIALVLFVGFVPAVAMAGPAPKVEVCHIPPDDPDNYHTINVSENALGTHLAHGDLGGSCNALCDTICDDGNACTVDHSDDCEENGCLDVPGAVDCSDGDLCTVDSCAPASGCANTPVTCIDPDLCTNSSCAADTGLCEESPLVCPDEYSCSLETGECEPDFECTVDEDCSDGYTCIQNECVEGAARNLRGPDTNSDCSGPEVGYTTVVVVENDGGLQVDVEFTNGPANYSTTVYWVCTTEPGGCHGEACGFIDLGTVTTDGSGQGSFSTILPNGNPYPGSYVHFDVGGPPWFTSITHDEIFPVPAAAPAASSAVSSSANAGDPTDAN